MKFLIQPIERLAPRVLWRRRIAKWKINTGENEQVLLPSLCDRKKASIDIGAADGAYTAHLLLHSSSVIAFEPRMYSAVQLRALFKNTKLVTVEAVALSDAAGQIQMRIPDRATSSTIEPKNSLGTLSGFTTIEVPRKRLDDYQLSSIGFVKIDVEGHEQAVLEGARATLERERPIVLIEAEQRHNPGSVAAVTSFFKAMDFKGFFFLDRKLIPLGRFDAKRYQNPSNLDENARRTGVYINNFLFVPPERLSYVASFVSDSDRQGR